MMVRVDCIVLVSRVPKKVNQNHERKSGQGGGKGRRGLDPGRARGQ